MVEEKNFACPVCGKEFSKEESMLQHRRDAHQKSERSSEKNISQSSTKKPFRIGKYLPYIIGIVILLGVIFIIYWSLSSTTNIAPIGSFNLTSSFVPYRGNASAKINLIEFGDFQCSACEAFFTQIEPQILQNYINPAKVKFYFMDFIVIGSDSNILAEGSWCANDQGLYYDYYDYVYSHQGAENSGWGSASNLKNLVSAMPGLNTTQFNSCLDSGIYAQRVQQLNQLGRSSGVTATPTFFVGNDQIGYTAIIGAQPYSVFQQDIDSQLARV